MITTFESYNYNFKIGQYVQISKDRTKGINFIDEYKECINILYDGCFEIIDKYINVLIIKCNYESSIIDFYIDDFISSNGRNGGWESDLVEIVHKHQKEFSQKNIRNSIFIISDNHVESCVDDPEENNYEEWYE